MKTDRLGALLVSASALCFVIAIIGAVNVR